MLLKQPGKYRGHKTMLVLLALMVTFKGAEGQSEVPPVGPARVNAEVGSLVTLSVLFSVADDAVVKWSMGSLPVVTWKLGSDVPADVADAHSDVLRLERDGSLSLVDVPLSYSHNYTVVFTKSGVADAQAVFELKVYERPLGYPECSVHATVSNDLQYRCQWPGGAPRPSLAFPSVSNGSVTAGVLNLTLAPSEDLDWKTIVCRAQHPLLESSCNVTAQRPLGYPECSVHATVSNDLQYRCQWPGGAPRPSLAFPSVSNGSVTAGVLNLTLAPSEDLDWKTIVCRAQHPLLESSCNVTARQPVEFLPRVGASVDPDGRIAVTIECLSDAVPDAVVTWLRGGQAITSSNQHQISANTTQLTVRHFNTSEFLRDDFRCICSNPLGNKGRTTRLLGPSISDSSLLPNQEGTAVTLTWEVPPLSLVTGFDVQMRGPALDDTRQRSGEFRSIQVKPGSARSAGVLNLDPKSTYHFRVIPSAGRMAGEPSMQNRIGPGDGLSGAAIAGIAAGIPCGILALLISTALIYLSVSHCKRSGQPRYPVSRAVEKAVASQPDSALPDYNKLQAPSELSLAVPKFVPPPPVRTATTV